MVVGAFPAVKLAVLLFKQISKPLANFAKERAKNNRFFRTYVCMPPAHFYNWCEVKSKMWIMNMGKPVNVPQMNEQAAIELGANLLGEGIIFTVGSVLLILEYNRSSNKEAAKEEERLKEMERLHSTIHELYFATQKQDTQIRELQRSLFDIENRVVVKPWVAKKDSKEDSPPPEPPAGIASAKTPQVVQNTSEIPKASTPYPDRGIIMKSLNYIELSVFNIHQDIAQEVDESPPTPTKSLYIRKPSLVNEALLYLKHDVKGIL